MLWNDIHIRRKNYLIISILRGEKFGRNDATDGPA
jgi:hypothetical protein